MFPLKSSQFDEILNSSRFHTRAMPVQAELRWPASARLAILAFGTLASWSAILLLIF